MNVYNLTNANETKKNNPARTLAYETSKISFFARTWAKARVFFCLIMVFAMSLSYVSAQQGDMSAGGHLTFGSGDEYSNIGIGAKFRYNVTDPMRLEGSFTYFFKKDFMSMWDISANIQWLFPVSYQFAVYPLAGFSIMGMKLDLGDWGSGSDNGFGLNFGGGADFNLNDQIALTFELKYRVGLGDFDLNRLGISAGVAFKF